MISLDLTAGRFVLPASGFDIDHQGTIQLLGHVRPSDETNDRFEVLGGKAASRYCAQVATRQWRRMASASAR